jgi:predicted  nucleic acid-binding Zn-ribbon protein
MNSDIQIMIELQKYWHAMLSAKNKIEQCEKIIRDFEDELSGSRKNLAGLSGEIKELKAAIRRHELDLDDKDGRIKKLDERKKIIHTQKELHALEKEIDVLRFEIGGLEEKILAMIDRLDEKEKDHADLERVVMAKENQFSEKRRMLTSDITVQERAARENEEKFNGTIDRLSPAYRSKFAKMLQSRDGTAVAKVEGEICGYCNFTIPPSLAIEVSDSATVGNCTNCGRFIYK